MGRALPSSEERGALALTARKEDKVMPRKLGTKAGNDLFANMFDAPTDTPHVVLHGDPISGFRVVGPFATEAEADAWCDEYYENQPGIAWSTALQSIDS